MSNPEQQKQSLNEVENLYFHHSHSKGTKPSQFATTVSTEDAGFAAASNPQSSLSFLQSRVVGTEPTATASSSTATSGGFNSPKSATVGQMLPPATVPINGIGGESEKPVQGDTPLPSTPTIPHQQSIIPSTILQSPATLTSSPRRPQQQHYTYNVFTPGTSYSHNLSPFIPPPSPSSPSKSQRSNVRASRTHTDDHAKTPSASASTSTILASPYMSQDPRFMFNSTASHYTHSATTHGTPASSVGGSHLKPNANSSNLTYDSFWSTHASPQRTAAASHLRSLMHGPTAPAPTEVSLPLSMVSMAAGEAKQEV